MKWPLKALAGALLFAMSTAGTLAQDATEITADKFVVDEGSSRATFSGNVEIRQPDLTVWANTVVVRYGPGGPSDLKDFEAVGNVRIKQPEQTATGDRGVYDPKVRILTLTGNVVVTNESGTVSGPELVVDIAKGTSAFTGGKSGGGRVTGIFTAPEGQAGE